MECGVIQIRKKWTTRKENINRLEAFEIWIWQRRERISWMEPRTNEEILQMMEEKGSLNGIIQSQHRK